jgi:putative transposase
MPYSRLFYHFVWATKERAPLITEDNRESLYAVISAKVEEFKGVVHAINGTADHVHLVVTLPPTLSLARFIGQVKGSSSHLASRLAKDGGAFTWQSEYGVVSLSESYLPTVVRYVHLQQQHHAANTLNRALETCE